MGNPVGALRPRRSFAKRGQYPGRASASHIAEIDRIEPYGDEGKYKVIFKSPAQAIGPIPIGSAPQGTMQGPRYTSHKKLLAATSVGDLVPWG